MRVIAVICVVLATGCRALFGIHDVALASDAGGAIDAPIDAPPDAPPGVTCYGDPWRVCFDQPLAAPVTLSVSQTIDTASSPLCAAHTASAEIGDACVIAGTTITASATLKVIGSKPVVLVAGDSITITGLLDVSTHTRLGQVGAGADPACTNGTAPTASATGGGGAGASFGGAGGNGGKGTSGGNGGTRGPTAPATSLRGGCRGQDGAGFAGHGVGGVGGGAVLLIAASITVGAAIDASGGAGTGALGGTGGGGGGGSGGMIAFEASTIMFAGNVYANGGGGGEASGSGTTGNDGQESTDPLAPGAGGSGAGTNSGDGGPGSAGTTLVGGGGGDGVGGGGASGGGGGGGAGVVVVHAPSVSGNGTNVAPPST